MGRFPVLTFKPYGMTKKILEKYEQLIKSRQEKKSP